MKFRHFNVTFQEKHLSQGGLFIEGKGNVD